MGFDADELSFLLGVQDGVLRRAQLAELGLTYADLQRQLRRNELVRLSPGVYADHTGELSWVQSTWAAVMRCWPAALTHDTAWRRTPIVHVAVSHDRRLAAPPGVRVHRMRHFEELVDWRKSPPRVTVAHAALDAAAVAPDELAAVGLLSDVVQGRHATVAQLRAALATRARLARGRWLEDVLDDLALGTNSVLEREYLHRVERAHGLPRAERQVAVTIEGRRVDRDVSYRRFGLVVELDGRTFHDSAAARDADLDRDLDAAVTEAVRTVRLGWGQVMRRACRTARRLDVLLRRGGWEGSMRQCGRCP